MPLNLKIDESKCIHCGECIRECPGWVLTFSAENVPQVDPRVGEKGCIGCQHCMAVCPAGALSVFNRDPGQSDRPHDDYRPETLLSLMRNRRSCRRYRPESVAPDILEHLKEAMNFVPTGVNNRGLHFSLIDDPAVMNDFRSVIQNYFRDLLQNEPESPVLAKMPRYRRQFEEGRDVILRNAPHAVIAAVRKNAPCAAIDPVIALSYFELLANSYGLGTLWCGLFVMMLKLLPELEKHLQIPDGYTLSYAMLFGYPAVRYFRAVQPENVSLVSVK